MQVVNNNFIRMGWSDQLSQRCPKHVVSDHWQKCPPIKPFVFSFIAFTVVGHPSFVFVNVKFAVTFFFFINSLPPTGVAAGVAWVYFFYGRRSCAVAPSPPPPVLRQPSGFSLCCWLVNTVLDKMLVALFSILWEGFSCGGFLGLRLEALHPKAHCGLVARTVLSFSSFNFCYPSSPALHMLWYTLWHLFIKTHLTLAHAVDSCHVRSP